MKFSAVYNFFNSNAKNLQYLENARLGLLIHHFPKEYHAKGYFFNKSENESELNPVFSKNDYRYAIKCDFSIHRYKHSSAVIEF